MQPVHLHRTPVSLTIVLGLCVAVFAALSIGRYPISPTEVLSVLRTGPLVDRSRSAAVIFNIRLPRILLALLVGSGLAASGAAFQSLFANPLATPDTIGVASGSSFGAVLALFFGWSAFGVQAASLAGGLIAVSITILTGKSKQTRSPATIILAGIIIASLFNALISLVKYTADVESQLPGITYWLMGSLSNANYEALLLGAPFIIVGLILLLLLRWRLNFLLLSDDEAKGSGTDIRMLRIVTILAATMTTASSVSMCGQVGWVGLLVPHMCRMVLGSDNRHLIPASIGVGALFMLVIDTFARSAFAAEVPISVLTAIIGAPFFISILRRQGRWGL